MTTGVQDPQAAVAAAKTAVDQAEADLVSGKRSISATALNKLRDGWRHADLTAQCTRVAAEEQRRSARLEGLEAIGAEVDKLAQPEHTGPLNQALRDVTAACARFRALAEDHDADVADLIAAAADLRTETAAPAGPRETSAYVALEGDSIAHRRTTVRPLGSRVQAALGHALGGDIDRAVAEVRTAVTAPEAKRPDHLLRNARSGNLLAITGSQSDVMKGQLKTNNPRSGDLIELDELDVDRYMKGELA
jgi:hypothetical protein